MLYLFKNMLALFLQDALKVYDLGWQTLVNILFTITLNENLVLYETS